MSTAWQMILRNSNRLSKNSEVVQISSGKCTLCCEKYSNFIEHLILKPHINRNFLTKEFCHALSIDSKYICSAKSSSSFTSLQSLVICLKSCRLPSYFKNLYSCHKCFLVIDSVPELHKHVRMCQFSNVNSEDYKPAQSTHLNGTLNSKGKMGNVNGICNGKSLLLGKEEKIEIRVTKAVLRSSSLQNNQRNDIYSSPSKQMLESRSTKRLLRNLKKPTAITTTNMSITNSPKNKFINKLNKQDTANHNKCDAIIFSTANKHKYKKYYPLLKKCHLCNRKNFKCENSLRAHYKNVHNFVEISPCLDLLARVPEEKKYYQFRCLTCLKMFENFYALGQHRCKFIFPNQNGFRKSSYDLNGSQSETKPDYKSESEFFKNVGLRRKPNSVAPCVHSRERRAEQSPGPSSTITTRLQSATSLTRRHNPPNKGVIIRAQHRSNTRKTLCDDDVIITWLRKPTS